jgi:hypothetical protein
LSKADAWQDFNYFTSFGQNPTWKNGGVDYLALFKEYQASKDESLALDMIADVSASGSAPGTLSCWISTKHDYAGLKAARLRIQPSKTIQDMWPTVDTVIGRVFAPENVSYDDVCRSVANEPDQLDPIVMYCSIVLRS